MSAPQKLDLAITLTQTEPAPHQSQTENSLLREIQPTQASSTSPTITPLTTASSGNVDLRVAKDFSSYETTVKQIDALFAHRSSLIDSYYPDNDETINLLEKKAHKLIATLPKDHPRLVAAEKAKQKRAEQQKTDEIAAAKRLQAYGRRSFSPPPTIHRTSSAAK